MIGRNDSSKGRNVSILFYLTSRLRNLRGCTWFPGQIPGQIRATPVKFIRYRDLLFTPVVIIWYNFEIGEFHRLVVKFLIFAGGGENNLG